MKRILALWTTLILAGLLTASVSPAQTHVFHRYAVHDATSVQTVSDEIEQALIESGYQVLVSYAPGRPEACSDESNLIVAVHRDNVIELLSANAVTAPYFAPTRIVVFKDPSGIHVGAVNPASVLRTILMDAPGADTLSTLRMSRFEHAIERIAGISHEPVPFGQARKRGHIGKTMGVMAGGPFDSKIEVIHSTSLSPAESAALLQDFFAQPSGEWNLDVQYVLELPEENGFVVGVSGERMESKSFDIVGAGADKARSDFACAGVAHAASYPLELYLAPVDGGTEVRAVSAMYRMKMYFEDAGKWAFMKNMGMPGSIAAEIARRVEFSLERSASL